MTDQLFDLVMEIINMNQLDSYWNKTSKEWLQSIQPNISQEIPLNQLPSLIITLTSPRTWISKDLHNRFFIVLENQPSHVMYLLRKLAAFNIKLLLHDKASGTWHSYMCQFSATILWLPASPFERRNTWRYFLRTLRFEAIWASFDFECSLEGTLLSHLPLDFTVYTRNK